MKKNKARLVVKTYPNGLQTVVRHMPGFNSVSTNIRVGIGSSDEAEHEQGLSHLVEHLLFDTKNRTSAENKDFLGNYGAELNAFTNHHSTSFTTLGLKSNFDTCNEVLSDMFSKPNINKQNLLREQMVIAREIADGMHDSAPQSSVEAAYGHFNAGTPYARKIVGPPDAVHQFNAGDVKSYRRRHYVAPNIVMGFAGDVTSERVDKMVEELWLPYFGNAKAKPKLTNNSADMLAPTPKFIPVENISGQHNATILMPTPNMLSDERFPLRIANDIFHRNLFNTVRERLGLVYGIASSLMLRPVNGNIEIGFSCAPQDTERVMQAISEEIERFKNGDLSSQEVQRAKNVVKSRLLYRSEDTVGTNRTNVDTLAYYNGIRSHEELLDMYDSIGVTDVQDVADRYMNPKKATVAVAGKSAGRIKSNEFGI